jgi:hypothetical protein
LTKAKENLYSEHADVVFCFFLRVSQFWISWWLPSHYMSANTTSTRKILSRLIPEAADKSDLT